MKSHRSTLIIDRFSEGSGNHLDLVQLPDERPRLLARPHRGKWGGFPSFSPDGLRFAIDFEFEPACDEHGMAVIDIRSGELQLCKGRFLGFATTPAWRADGSGFAFSAPFDKYKVLSVDLADQTIHEKRMKKIVSKPLVDIAALK